MNTVDHLKHIFNMELLSQLALFFVLITVVAALPNGGCAAFDPDVPHCQHTKWRSITNLMQDILKFLPYIIAVRFVQIHFQKGKSYTKFSTNDRILISAILLGSGVGLYAAGTNFKNSIDPLDTLDEKYSTHWLRVASPTTQNIGISLGLVGVLSLWF